MVKAVSRNKYLIITLLFALCLRLIAINQSLWLDEAIGAIAVKKFGYFDLLTKFMPADNHSPFYYLMLKFWTNIFGYSELAVRSLSILASLLAIYYASKFSRFAGVFLATSQFYVYYSQEARMYPITSFFCIFAIYYLHKAIKNQKLIKNWALYSIGITGLVFSDYVPVFFLPAVFLYVCLHKPKKIIYYKFLISHLPVLLLGFFWLPIFAQQLENAQGLLTIFPQWKTVAGGASIKNILLLWIKFTMGRVTLVNKTAYALFVFLITLIYLPVLSRFTRNIKLTLLLITPIVLTAFVSLFFPAFIYFRFTYLYPLFAILIAKSLSSFKSKVKYILGSLLVFVNLISLTYYFTDKNQQREEWRQAVAFVEQVSDDSSIVLFSFSDAPAGYRWYEKSIIPAYGATDNLSADKVRTVERTKNLVEEKEVVYYFEYLRDLSDPNRYVEETLKNEGFEITEVYGQFKGGVGQIFKWQRKS